jgi:hypothetical protein
LQKWEQTEAVFQLFVFQLALYKVTGFTIKQRTEQNYYANRNFFGARVDNLTSNVDYSVLN